jgi:beta-glucanase (GH16 family)
MKTHALLLTATGLVVGALGTSCSSSDEVVEPNRWVETMSDEFDSDILSPDLWAIETGYGPEDNGWGNDEWQLYTDSPENIRIEDGVLVISAQCPVEPCEKRDGSITSARIKTQDLFEQQYGRFEARIKLPEGQGFWPAFWMLGANIDDVPWPGCGEIDILEYQGQRPERVFGTLHGPGYSGGASISGDIVLEGSETFADDYHVYAVEWDPGRVSFWVDDEVYHIVRSTDATWRGDWVFNNPFFIILNFAVGGTIGGPVGPDTEFPAEVLVDYVRVFERAQ